MFLCRFSNQLKSANIVVMLVTICTLQNIMNALQVSSEEIKFTYNTKTHLHTTLTIKNNHDYNCYFKFKVTRPKYYLIKLDHGFCDAKTSVTISIMLHQEGVNEGEGDKIKLYFKLVGKDHIEPTRGWEKQEPQASSIRFPIVIEGLPQEFKKISDRVKSSEVKSLANSKFDQARSSSIPISQSSIKQKQNRVNHLKSEIDLLKKGSGKLQKTEQGWKEYLIVGGVGLIMGFMASIWL